MPESAADLVVLAARLPSTTARSLQMAAIYQPGLAAETGLLLAVILPSMAALSPQPAMVEQESAADMFVLLAPSSSSAALSPQPAEMRRPGIGGGKYGSGGSVTISGGNVTATGGKYGAAGIGAGLEGSEVTFKTGANGHALIFANGGIGDKTNQKNWSGLIFEGDAGTIYGKQTLSGDLEITGNQILTVPEGSTLTVPQNVTLTCNTTLTNNGTITGSGTLDGAGNLVGSGIVAGSIVNNLQKDSAVAVTVNPSPATHGSKVTITAKISKAANTFARAAENNVEFFVGTDSNRKSLGTATVSGNTATLSDVEISKEKGFAVGENTITAE